MRKRWLLRRLPFLIFTFILILYVDSQLRTGSHPKLTTSVAHHLSASALHRFIQEVPSTANDAQKVAGNGSNGNEGHTASKGTHVIQPKLKLEDIFIAVKTTGRFHNTRLALLLETWITRTKAHVSMCVCVREIQLSCPKNVRQVAA